MTELNMPVFSMTADVDWASEYCIQDFLDLVKAFDIKPTVYGTHRSEVLDRAYRAGDIEVGVHPNFLPGSTHGEDVKSVIDHVFRLFPNARSFRSHCFYDTSPMAAEMKRRGIHYDSNLCLYQQHNLVPLRHSSGILRFPVFWEDDTHWNTTDGDWELDHFLERFLTPGLKVLNFHPFNVAANTPNAETYYRTKKHITTFGPDDVAALRKSGPGTRTFLLALLERLKKRGFHFHTLGELYEVFSRELEQEKKDPSAGRMNKATQSEYEWYWKASNEERQQYLKTQFNLRNPCDPYATSRDTHMRELEIEAILQNLPRTGPILDLGCGNGYTLVSLARKLEARSMLGVDFAEALVAGAKKLVEDNQQQLRSTPQFISADVLEYVSMAPDNSFHCVITQRFLQNMPDTHTQCCVLKHIFRILSAGGRLLMFEGSADGFEALNDLRSAMGLARVPPTSADNVSALRFRDADIETLLAQELGFRMVDKKGMSTYFVISRVLHPLLVAPLQPRFDASLNKLARDIQKHLRMTPGIGSNTLWVCEKPA
jgi:ubiquinone/menaquinone biosynthesis C-methylase UbiE